jgi:mono/diheme cytochrome c family protein
MSVANELPATPTAAAFVAVERVWIRRFDPAFAGTPLALSDSREVHDGGHRRMDPSGGRMENARMTAAIVVIGIAVMSGPVMAAEGRRDAAAAAKGRVTYGRYCVSCHGPQAKGDGPLAGDLRVAVPDLTTLSQRNGGKYPYDRVIRIIESGETVRAHGTPVMPAWGDAFKKTKGTGEATAAAAIRNLGHYLWMLQPPAK